MSGDSCSTVNPANTDISDLSPLNQITSVGGDLQIGKQVCDKLAHRNPLLTSLSGLENLVTIGGSLNIESSDLKDFTGLNGLQSIGVELFIVGSDSLTNFNGLNNLISVPRIRTSEWYFSCGNVFETVTISNTGFTSLEGLDNLQFINSFGISSPNLTVCNVPFVCNLLASGGGVFIGGGEGCSDVNEIAVGCTTTCAERDYIALRALYLSTDGDNWTDNTGWLTAAEFETNPTMPLGTDLSTWYGIFTNAEGCVTCIDMDGEAFGCISSPPNVTGNNLTGSLPSEIEYLTELAKLHLLKNQIKGSIPSTIGNLVNLEELYLNSNQFNDSLPLEIGNLVNLKYLQLSDNNFSGSLPPEIGNLGKLIYMRLSNNNFSGNLPSEIGNLNKLESLYLFTNNFSSKLPPEIGSLGNLEYLDLTENNFSGNIPPEIGNLSNLWFLKLSYNEFSDVIPSEIGNLSNLNVLDLALNQLSGVIPPEIGDLSNLQWLQLSDNQLSGGIPPEIGNLSDLTYLKLSDNPLGGNMPPEMGNMNSLKTLIIDDSQLIGCYDNDLSNLCDQLVSYNISDGNALDATWEDFCATGAGTCIVDNDYTYQGTLTVYPIPAKDFVVFEVPNIAAADEIVLYDITGKEISRQAFPQDKQLVISDLSGGVYIYRMSYDDEMYSGKIVVE